MITHAHMTCRGAKALICTKVWEAVGSCLARYGNDAKGGAHSRT